MMTARIAAALAGKRAQRLADSSYLVPCPVSSHGKGRGDRSPSLRISDGKTRLLVKCFAGCDPRDVLAELRRRGFLDDRPTPVRSSAAPTPKPQTPDAYARRQHHKAAWLWSKRQPIAGTPAEIYLREVRRIACPLPATFAFLPPSKPQHHPALMSAFAFVDEPEPGLLGEPRSVSSVHLTLLKPSGLGKADVEKPKIIVGSPGGLPIVVAPPNDLLGLAVTEGVEDALTAHQATGLGAWAAGSASFMPALADNVPAYIEAITIFAHADKAGQDGARKIALALERRGIEVFLEGLAS
jgi:hypothetical protein